MPLPEKEQVTSYQQKDYKIEPWSIDRLFDKTADVKNDQQESTVADDSTQIRDHNIIAFELVQEQQREGRFLLQSRIIQGQLLLEVKELLPHGDFQPFVSAYFWGGERLSQTCMKLALGYPNPQSTAYLNDLTIAKAEKILNIEPEERLEFLESIHEVKGSKKKAKEMSDKDFFKLFSMLYPQNNKTENDNGNIETESSENDTNNLETVDDSSLTEIEGAFSENAAADSADLTSTENIDAENFINISVSTENTNKIVTNNETGQENASTANIGTEDDNIEDIELNTPAGYERHVKDFDDCFNIVCTNLAKMFTAREICQDKPDIHNGFNDKLISMFEKYLNMLGYMLYKGSDKLGDEEFKPQNINELEHITDMGELAG